MDLSVIIPVKKNDETIVACLKAVCASTLTNFEVVIILDGWESLDYFQAWEKDVRVRIIPFPKSGPAVCRNYGVKISNGTWISFVDSDVLIEGNTLAVALHSLSENGEDGLIGSYDNTPSAPSFVSKFRNILHHHHHQRNHHKAGVFWGAFSIIRKKAFEDVGGFDENFDLPSIEDVELGIRLANRGYVIRIDADIQVKHLKNWTFYNWMRTDIFLRAKPWAVLMYRHGNQAGNHLNTDSLEKTSALFTLLTLGLLLCGFNWTWLWALVPVTILIFILTQLSFYRLASRKFSFLPSVLVLHHIYFIFALTGFFLGVFSFKKDI
tara:strand:+ start:8652 stop:9620 length:969 start_codon:yes stop_codon:yes gene_type:complete